ASAVTTTTPVAIPSEIAETSARPAKTKKGKKPKTTGGEPTLPAAEAIDPQRQAVAARLARFASANPAIPIAHDDPRLGASAPVANVAITNVALDNGHRSLDDAIGGVSFASGAFERVGRRARRIAFVGPTGAGKTTTLAKPAAKAQLEHRRRGGP